MIWNILGPAPTVCCSGYCCEQQRFNLQKELPCVNHLMCRDLNFGDFCCSDKTNSSEYAKKCCNEDPNPPPKTTTSTMSAANKIESLFILVINIFFF